jgi:hypothetical protein
MDGERAKPRRGSSLAQVANSRIFSSFVTLRSLATSVRETATSVILDKMSINTLLIL